MNVIFSVIFSIALLLSLPIASLAQPVPVDLGTLGGGMSRATAINANGQVVGYSTVGDGETHAFSWTQSGGMVDLGTLGGTETVATAVNNHGQVVGYFRVPGHWARHAFSWTAAGGMVDFGSGRRESVAVGVNDDGLVAGTSNDREFERGWGGSYEVNQLAFGWTAAGGRVDLGALGPEGGSVAAAVNANGQVVGASSSVSGFSAWHAFSWTASDGMIDLGTLGGQDSYAYAVNAEGHVVGQSSIVAPPWIRHAFVWTAAGGMLDLGVESEMARAISPNGQVAGRTSSFHAFSWTQAGGMVDLGTLGGQYSDAYAVNELGQVVGESLTVGFDNPHAFSWTEAGGMMDLGTLGGPFSYAYAVNDKGQVVGSSNVAYGAAEHATLWNVALLEAVSVTPSGGSGMTQTFTLHYSDSLGAAEDLASARMRIGLASNVGPGTCTAKYNAITGAIQLLDDTGTAWADGVLGKGSLANSQCTLNLATSSATTNGRHLALMLTISFSIAFTGPRNIYMLAASGTKGMTTTGWQLRGTWTVPDVVAVVEPIAVSPSSGSGMTQAFTLQYSDSLGATEDLTSARVRFGASNIGPGTCTVKYSAMTGIIELLNDAGTEWAEGTLGVGTLSNGQCALDLESSAATPNGTTLTLILNVRFAPTFMGLKNIYMLAKSAGGSNSGWQPKGTWTPNPNIGPADVRALRAP